MGMSLLAIKWATISLCIFQLLQRRVDSVGVHDYGAALTKSLLFFEAQRSGILPYTQRVQWRDNSAMKDGNAEGVDLVGGYYIGGDNVKYGFPMAFAVTMLSWSVIEFGDKLHSVNELSHTLDAIRWGTDYFIKAHTQPSVLYGQVGDGASDRECWERPEDMDTPRTASKIDPTHPGSDLAGETAAALAAASMVFQLADPYYSSKLVDHAKQLFDFADQYRGPYHASIPGVEEFYRSSEYEDELLWAAAWLYRATQDEKYLQYIDQQLNAGGIRTSFSWDDKFAGVQVFIAANQLRGRLLGYPNFPQYKTFAEQFICSNIGMGYINLNRTEAGLLWIQYPDNLQYVTSASFLLTIYAEALITTGSTLHCFHGTVTPDDIFRFVIQQVDYILGTNPAQMSYMVGYGPKYPVMVPHRGASIVSIKVNRTFDGCKTGFMLWNEVATPNPNVIEGGVIGGAGLDDAFYDDRGNLQSQPLITAVAPLVGILAKLV